VKAVEIQSFARATLLRLPLALRREIGHQLFDIAAGNYQGLVSFGGGVYSFEVTGGIAVYIEDRTDRIVVFHIVR
jgi:hypothetical protein